MILTATIILGGAFTANTWMHNTPCGIAVQTVSPDFFKDPIEADAFYEELNVKYCGGTNPDKPGGGGPPGEVDPAPPPAPPQN